VIKRAIGIIGISGVLLAAGCQIATFSQDARRKGVALYDQGNYGDAAGAFQDATQQMPTDYLSHYYLARTYDKLGDTQRAIQSYKSARDTRLQTVAGIQDEGTRDKIYLGLANAIAKSSGKDAEIEILRTRAIAARNGDDLIVLAEVFAAAGDPDSALQTFDEVTKKYPRDAWYAKEYGLYLAKVGLKARAKTVLTESNRLHPDGDVQAALKGL
jgi:tetratricopeptide (TPR) repeat protein